MLLCQYIIYSLFYVVFELLYQIKMKEKTEKILKNEVNITELEMSTIRCCICLEDIDIGIKLNCSHIIHKGCLEELLNNQFMNCPLCAQNMV